ncbi:tumor necrosis factor receptor superfamily member 14-like isoform X2 [Cottoperca gobio]|uniref:Tumor necrosis factor receptor superfamily member 14-like isoform X2 n=1 Tax=Cottoperca gobio TaxID=56716 RepID=A0A6J2Q3N4_COTGO|nr:tumor necrosis factor receptor superfamily member 14-like isoform X2 [Cottoperca gobio]
MLLRLVVFGFVPFFLAPGLCCRLKEYATSDSQCCPMCHEDISSTVVRILVLSSYLSPKVFSDGGTVVRRDCTPQSGTRCGPCMNGTFMNQPNGLINCFTCTTCDHGHGLFAYQSCSATTDTVCHVLHGYLCKGLMDHTGCSLAQKHTRCAAGQRIKEPGKNNLRTSRTDTVCEPCPSGYFSQDGVNCTDWNVCSETEVHVKKGSLSSDVVCGTSSRHRYYCIPVILIFTICVLLIGGLWTRECISRCQKGQERRAIVEGGAMRTMPQDDGPPLRNQVVSLHLHTLS